MAVNDGLRVKRVTRFGILVAGLLLVGSPSLVCAQQTTPPPEVHPGTLQSPQQRTERYYQQRSEKQKPESVKNPVKEAATANHPHATSADVHFVLEGVRFSHSVFLSDAQLQAAAKPYIGHEVDIEDLDAMLAKINGLYKQRHITTARAVLGGQTIHDGIVHVELVEGRLGKLVIKGNDHTRESFIRRRISQQPDAVVDTDALRQDLVYLNRTTNLQVQALLRPGATRGQSDILLQTTEPARRSLDAFVDNAGVDSTGRTRVGLQGHMYGLLGVGDMLNVSLAHAKGGNDGSLAYSAVVNRRNGKLGFSYSQSQINIINGAYRDLDITGQSQVLSLEFNQPFVATQHWTLNGVAAFSSTRSRTQISGKQIADTRSRSGSVGISFGHRTNYQQWALTQIITRVQSQEPLAGRSNFLIASGNFAGIQRLGDSKYTLRLDAGWQFGSNNELPSANLFQIGGIGSVRGYERGILSGLKGYYLDLELHRMLGKRSDIYAFVDHGAIYDTYPDSGKITGGGLGAVFRYKSWLTASLDVARAFNTDIIPDQGSMRVDFRVAIHWE